MKQLTLTLALLAACPAAAESRTIERNAPVDYDRMLPELAGPTTPVYHDPNDAVLLPAESYQTDPTQPASPLSPQHATLLTRSMRNTIVALGYTPACDDDEVLANAISAGLLNVRQVVPLRSGFAERGIWTFDASYRHPKTTDGPAAPEWWVPLSLPIGGRIKQVSARTRFDQEIGEIASLELRSIEAEEVITVHASIAIGIGTTTVELPIPATQQTVLEGRQYYLAARITADALADFEFYSADLTLDLVPAETA